MRTPGAESVVALATAAILVAASGAAVATGTGSAAGAAGGGDAGLAFEPDVPAEYGFTATDEPGVATVDGTEYRSLRAALDAAEPGDVVRLRGRFDPADTVRVRTPNVTLRGVGERYPVIDGTGEDDVLVVNASDVVVDHVWVRNSGYDAKTNDAAVWVDGEGVVVRDSRVTDMTFGIWVDGVTHVRLVDNVIVGRESVTPRTDRGNGVQLWKADDAYVAGNRITDARDGIYYSWASGVEARNNTMWDLRYGVHYMYSDHCTLANNTAFGNDVGYALMVSQDLRILNNTAVNNTGQSGHGVLVKSIDRTVIRGNHLVGNERGLFIYNSLDNVLARNLVAGNDVGVYLAAGSVRERVHHNTFVRNGVQVKADIGEQVAWNASGAGNYWDTASPDDVDDDGVSETRYQPAGLVQHVVAGHPAAAVFEASPAFAVVRLAESTLPVVEAPGVVDHHPLTEPPHDWRRYYATNRSA